MVRDGLRNAARPHGYSPRRASIGFTEAALRAGKADAAAASSRTPSEASARTSGSKGLTLKQFEEGADDAILSSCVVDVQPAIQLLSKGISALRMPSLAPME